MQSAVWADLSFFVSAKSADTLLCHLTPALVDLINSCCLLHRQSLPIHCERVIRKTSQYTLRSNVCQFLVNLQVKLTGTLGLHSETCRTVPSDSSVLIFASTSYETPVSSQISTSFSRIQGSYFATRIMFGWVMKYLYRVKYLQVSYRMQGLFFATPIMFGWVMKHLYQVRIVRPDNLFQKELIEYLLVGWIKPTQGQTPIFLYVREKLGWFNTS